MLVHKISNSISMERLSQIAEETAKDLTLQELIGYIQNGWPNHCDRLFLEVLWEVYKILKTKRHRQ